MTLSYNVPETAHPNSTQLSTYQIALILESKYHILQEFTEANIELIKKRIWEQFKRGRVDEVSLNEYVKMLWREWMVDGKTKWRTRASQERGDPSFIDTATFYLSVYPEVQFTEQELSYF